MSETISTETRKLTIHDHSIYISIITFNSLDEAPEKLDQKVTAAYHVLADDLLNQPGIEAQKSACLITDLTPIQDSLTQDAIEAWYDNATSDNIQTQQTLLKLFKRPVFTIVTLPGIEESYVQQRMAQINPNANPTHVVNDLAEAMELAQRLLGAAHRAS